MLIHNGIHYITHSQILEVVHTIIYPSMSSLLTKQLSRCSHLTLLFITRCTSEQFMKFPPLTFCSLTFYFHLETIRALLQDSCVGTCCLWAPTKMLVSTVQCSLKIILKGIHEALVLEHVLKRISPNLVLWNWTMYLVMPVVLQFICNILVFHWLVHFISAWIFFAVFRSILLFSFFG